MKLRRMDETVYVNGGVASLACMICSLLGFIVAKQNCTYVVSLIKTLV